MSSIPRSFISKYIFYNIAINLGLLLFKDNYSFIAHLKAKFFPEGNLTWIDLKSFKFGHYARSVGKAGLKATDV
jgi:hypothetical protein